MNTKLPKKLVRKVRRASARAQARDAAKHRGRTARGETNVFVTSKGSDDEWISMDELVGKLYGDDCDEFDDEE